MNRKFFRKLYKDTYLRSELYKYYNLKYVWKIYLIILYIPLNNNDDASNSTQMIPPN